MYWVIKQTCEPRDYTHCHPEHVEGSPHTQTISQILENFELNKNVENKEFKSYDWGKRDS